MHVGGRQRSEDLNLRCMCVVFATTTPSHTHVWHGRLRPWQSCLAWSGRGTASKTSLTAQPYCSCQPCYTRDSDVAKHVLLPSVSVKHVCELAHERVPSVGFASVRGFESVSLSCNELTNGMRVGSAIKLLKHI